MTLSSLLTEHETFPEEYDLAVGTYNKQEGLGALDVILAVLVAADGNEHLEDHKKVGSGFQSSDE